MSPAANALALFKPLKGTAGTVTGGEIGGGVVEIVVVVEVGSENAGVATAARDAAATARAIAPPVAVCQRRRLWM
jgi:hypothetical protein